MRLNSTKSTIIFVLGLVFFVPLQAFAVTKSVHDVHYKIGAPPDLVPFLIIGTIFVVVLFAYYKSSHVGKYEKFSLHCTKCGRFTRGLKCVICEARKSV
jgi:fatty acid desaturase